MSKKYSPWFPAYVIPERDGVYELAYLRDGKLRRYPYPFHIFDGSVWLSKAAKSPNTFDSKASGTPGRSLPLMYGGDSVWRGLAKEPK